MIDNRKTDKKELLNEALAKGEESGFIKDFDKDVFMDGLRQKHSKIIQVSKENLKLE